MTAANYKKCLAHVLLFEGGKVDHPRDPGGRTNQGVIQRVYDGWRARNGLSKQDVFLMRQEERDAIYREGYWEAIKGDELPSGIDLVVFDGAVNSGPHQSAKWLQRALKVNRIDGVVGPATLAAIKNHPNHDQLVVDILDRRLAFLRQLKTWSDFGRGWSSRVARVKKLGLEWASGLQEAIPLRLPEHIEEAAKKAIIEDAKPLPGKGPGDAATGAGVATGGLTGTIQQTKDSLAPLAGDGGWIDTILAALAITTAVLVIGGLAYRWYAGKVAHDRADALDLPSGVAA
jgi:lysozyme family protein